MALGCFGNTVKTCRFFLKKVQKMIFFASLPFTLVYNMKFYFKFSYSIELHPSAVAGDHHLHRRQLLQRNVRLNAGEDEAKLILPKNAICTLSTYLQHAKERNFTKFQDKTFFTHLWYCARKFAITYPIFPPLGPSPATNK